MASWSGGAVRRTLRVFISSPSDVREERLRAQLIIQRLARDYVSRVALVPTFWESEPLRATGHFQDEIEAPSTHDIVVLILWSRLGTPLPVRTAVREYRGLDGRVPVTGTEWEFEDALAAYNARGAPDLLVYRRAGDPGTSLTDEVRRHQQKAQWDALQAFWSRYFEDKGSFPAAATHYAGLDEFDARLEADLSKLIEAHLQRTAGPAEYGSAVILKGQPFLGLAAYDVADAPLFFGRDGATRTGLTRLLAAAEGGTAFLMVLGSSGTGKSSLARAGLLASLVSAKAIPSVGLWRRVLIRPGSAGGDTMQALAAALLGGDPSRDEGLPELAAAPGEGGVAALARHLRASAADVSFPFRTALAALAERQRTARAMLLHEEARLVLLVDQMEELFTRPEITTEEAALFIQVISGLAQSGVVWVVATMRSDMWHLALLVPGLLALTEAGARLDLLPPDGAELLEVIRRPARATGLAFEEDKDSRLGLDAVLAAAAAPGALPLLSVMLEELYRRDVRDAPGGGRTLTFASYRALGALQGAIATRAEAVWGALSDQDPAAAAVLPHVLRALVTAGADDAVTSCPARLDGFAPGSPARRLVDALLAPDVRLLAAEGDSSRAEVRIVHEALVAHWPRARDQLRADRRDIETRAILERLLRRWEEAPAGRRATALLAEQNLALGLDLARRWSIPSDTPIGGFIRASAQRAQASRTRTWAVTAVAFLIVAGVAAYTVHLRGVAEARADDAEKNHKLADEQTALANKLTVRATLAAAESAQQKRLAQEAEQQALVAGNRAMAQDVRSTKAAVAALVSEAGRLGADRPAAAAKLVQALQVYDGTVQPVSEPLLAALDALAPDLGGGAGPAWPVLAVGPAGVVSARGREWRLASMPGAPAGGTAPADVTAAGISQGALFLGLADGKVQSWSLDGHLLQEGHAGDGSAVQDLLPVGEDLFALDGRGALHRLGAQALDGRGSLAGRTDHLLVADPAGAWLVGTREGHAVILDRLDPVRDRILARALGNFRRGAVSGDQRLVALVDEAGQLCVLDPIYDLGACWAGGPQGVADAAFSSDGRSIHLLSSDQRWVSRLALDGLLKPRLPARAHHAVPGTARLLQTDDPLLDVLAVLPATGAAGLTGHGWLPGAIAACRLLLGPRSHPDTEPEAVRFCTDRVLAVTGRPAAPVLRVDALRLLADPDAARSLVAGAPALAFPPPPIPDGASDKARAARRAEFGLDGTPKDPAAARRSYEVCAAAGDSYCKYRLAVALSDAGSQDAGRAVALASVAADAGLALGVNLLGWYALEGYGGPQDVGAAARLFRQAHAMGDTFHAPRNLGDLGSEDSNAGVSPAEAAGFLRVAVDSGNPAAADLLAQLIRQGTAAEARKGEADDLLRLAATSEANAAVRLALHLDTAGGGAAGDGVADDGVADDGTAATRLRLSAARDGSRQALVHLAASGRFPPPVAAGFLVQALDAPGAAQEVARLLRAAGADPAEVRHWFRLGQDVTEAATPEREEPPSLRALIERRLAARSLDSSHIETDEFGRPKTMTSPLGTAELDFQPDGRVRGVAITLPGGSVQAWAFEYPPGTRETVLRGASGQRLDYRLGFMGLPERMVVGGRTLDIACATSDDPDSMAVTCTVTADGARTATVVTQPYFLYKQGGATHGTRLVGLGGPPVTRADVRFFQNLVNPLSALRNGWSTDPRASVFLWEIANVLPH